MVSPTTVDVYEALLETLTSQTKLLNDSQARRIFRSDVDLDPVQPYFVEEIVNSQCNRLGHDSLTSELFGNPVSDGSRGDRAVKDVCHIELAGNRSLVLHDKCRAGSLANLVQQIGD